MAKCMTAQRSKQGGLGLKGNIVQSHSLSAALPVQTEAKLVTIKTRAVIDLGFIFAFELASSAWNDRATN
jgi:hypothetical protein